MIRSFTVLILTLSLAWSWVAVAKEDSGRADRSLSPYFFVEDADPNLDALPLEGTRVNVAISGSIADVTVVQSYKNTGRRPINARYVFPASTRAAVHGLRMTIGDLRVVAKIKEREQAKREFDASKKAGKSAALLEQDRPNVFSMSLSNVMPGDRIEVTLEYTERLTPVEGTYEFVFPTVVGPRYSNQAEGAAPAQDRFVQSGYLRAGVPPASQLELSGTLSTAIPIRSLTSPTHGLSQHTDNDKLARFSMDGQGRSNGDRDFILRFRLSGDAIESGLSLYEASGEKFFALVVEPPARIAPHELPPREYVFIVDVSGSMHGFPLDTAKRVLREISAGLRPFDKFNVLLFSGGSRLLSPQSLPATPENVGEALRILDYEQGGGGTELLPALEQALSLTRTPGISRSFVVVTDGYIDADKRAMDFVRDNLGRANVFAFGIGSSVNRYLIEGLASAGFGEPFVVTDPKEAQRVAARFQRYVGAPALTNIRVEYEKFGAYDVFPASVPDVLAERPIVIQGKWRGPLDGAITVRGVSGTGTFTKRFEIASSTPRQENRALRYSWARTKIASLSDFAGEPSARDRATLVALGLNYNLLTRYTSFLAVSERVRNPNAPATDVSQPPPMPAGVSELAVGETMHGAPEPEFWLLLASFVLLVSGVLVVRARRRQACLS